MSDVKDTIPRSTLTTEQQRRLGAVQAAKMVLYGQSYNVDANMVVGNMYKLRELANYIYAGDS